jgi:hypothetical protein
MVDGIEGGYLWITPDSCLKHDAFIWYEYYETWRCLISEEEIFGQFFKSVLIQHCGRFNQLYEFVVWIQFNKA